MEDQMKMTEKSTNLSKPRSENKSSNWLLLKSKINSSTKVKRGISSATSSVKRSKASLLSENHSRRAQPNSTDTAQNNTTPASSNNEDDSIPMLTSSSAAGIADSSESFAPKSSFLQSLEKSMRRKVVGLDCEMVGLGVNGRTNALARCSLVSYDGAVLYDKIIRPKGFVTDFRTKWSGIKKSDLRKEKDNVVTFEECQESVAKLLKNKILVGHALQNDLAVLLLSHPRSQIRDTGRYQPYMKERARPGKYRPRSLKELTLEFLGKKIQSGEHDSVEDARCAVALYKKEMENWEKMLMEQKKQGREKGLVAPKQKTAKARAKPLEEDDDHNENSDHTGRDEDENDAKGSENENDEENGVEKEASDEQRGKKRKRSNDDSKKPSTSSSLKASKNNEVEIEMLQEDLQPQKKKKLSIKFKQSAEKTSSLISQLINDTKKVDVFVGHHHHHPSTNNNNANDNELNDDSESDIAASRSFGEEEGSYLVFDDGSNSQNKKKNKGKGKKKNNSKNDKNNNNKKQKAVKEVQDKKK